MIACDGLWKRFDNESAVDYVKTILKVLASHEVFSAVLANMLFICEYAQIQAAKIFLLLVRKWTNLLLLGVFGATKFAT